VEENLGKSDPFISPSALRCECYVILVSIEDAVAMLSMPWCRVGKPMTALEHRLKAVGSLGWPTET